jgi:hypothetical protein
MASITTSAYEQHIPYLGVLNTNEEEVGESGIEELEEKEELNDERTLDEEEDDDDDEYLEISDLKNMDVDFGCFADACELYHIKKTKQNKTKKSLSE